MHTKHSQDNKKEREKRERGQKKKRAMEAQIPHLDLSTHDHDSKKWKEMCDKVREACEMHGCFFVIYDKISNELRKNMFNGLKVLFDLSEEIKGRYLSHKPYCSYSGKCPVVPFLESFGIDDASHLDSALSFTNLMWPQGNLSFCGAMNELSRKMQELNFLILRMILESYGMENLYESHVEDKTTVFRVMKYIAPNITATSSSNEPDSNATAALGLVAHTDKNALTILCQNEVQGLEIQTKNGDWAQVVVPHNAFTVVVGDVLKAWSNGRLQAPRHRVMISGDKDRYSCGLFSMPKEGAMIEVPNELVDHEHPLLYRPFNYTDYLSYYVSKLSDDALEIYAGL